MMNNFARAEEEYLTPPEETVVYQCKQCGCDICMDEDYLEYDTETFCDSDCMVSYLLEQGEAIEKVAGEML